jgi:hypothetical protein
VLYSLLYATLASAVCQTNSKAVYHARRFGSPVRWHMALHSHADVPVLEEWHMTSKPPYACGVKGCASQLVTERHVRARLCAVHIMCPAVLRGGVPQRWCLNCRQFHAPEAFSGSQRCAPASLWFRSGQSKIDATVHDAIVRSV